MQTGVRQRPRRISTALIAVMSAVVLVAASGLTVSATGVKQYTATWKSGSSTVNNPPNNITVRGGATSVVLRLTNRATSASLGSANVLVPAAYDLGGGSLSGAGTASIDPGNAQLLRLRSLNLAPNAFVDVTINITTDCGDNVNRTWSLTVREGALFSGDTFTRRSPTVAPVTSVRDCFLRFVEQPDTTLTGAEITDGYDSSGDPLKVEIFDIPSGDVVIVNATVTLSIVLPNLPGGALSNGSAGAIAGVAEFPGLSINAPGPYKLRASSAVAENEPVTGQFMVSNTVETCVAPCTFTENDEQNNSYTTTPNESTNGAEWATSLNLGGLKISCEFAPFNYLDTERQPNAVWYVYDDGAGPDGSQKTNVIFIDKDYVQITADNGVSKYRICYSSPVRFKDRTGNLAQPDPWNTPDPVTGEVGPSVYFGTTWYTGLLPDCGKKPVAPCSLGWTGTGGNRIGTFLTPGGDPNYR